MSRGRLYPKQAAVLAAAADGAPLAEVARRLGMPRTQVASRLSEAYRRLGVGWVPRDERRAVAVREARRLGLIPAEATEGAVRPARTTEAPEPHRDAQSPPWDRTDRQETPPCPN